MGDVRTFAQAPDAYACIRQRGLHEDLIINNKMFEAIRDKIKVGSDSGGIYGKICINESYSQTTVGISVSKLWTAGCLWANSSPRGLHGCPGTGR